MKDLPDGTVLAFEFNVGENSQTALAAAAVALETAVAVEGPTAAIEPGLYRLTITRCAAPQ